MKFHENLSTRCRVVSCGWTDRRTYTTKLIVAFPNFSKAPETHILHYYSGNVLERLWQLSSFSSGQNFVFGVLGIIGNTLSRVQRSLLCQDTAVGHAV